jgi:hypothetical protein
MHVGVLLNAEAANGKSVPPPARTLTGCSGDAVQGVADRMAERLLRLRRHGLVLLTVSKFLLQTPWRHVQLTIRVAAVVVHSISQRNTTHCSRCRTLHMLPLLEMWIMICVSRCIYAYSAEEFSGTEMVLIGGSVLV